MWRRETRLRISVRAGSQPSCIPESNFTYRPPRAAREPAYLPCSSFRTPHYARRGPFRPRAVRPRKHDRRAAARRAVRGGGFNGRQLPRRVPPRRRAAHAAGPLPRRAAGRRHRKVPRVVGPREAGEGVRIPLRCFPRPRRPAGRESGRGRGNLEANRLVLPLGASALVRPRRGLLQDRRTRHGAVSLPRPLDAHECRFRQRLRRVGLHLPRRALAASSPAVRNGPEAAAVVQGRRRRAALGASDGDAEEQDPNSEAGRGAKLARVREGGKRAGVRLRTRTLQ